MYEAFNASHALLQPILLSVSVFAALMLAIPALQKLPELTEALARLWRRRSRNPIAVLDLSGDMPSGALHGPVAGFARSTRVLLANISGLAKDALNWPTDDLDRKPTGLFRGGPDLSSSPRTSSSIASVASSAPCTRSTFACNRPARIPSGASPAPPRNSPSIRLETTSAPKTLAAVNTSG
jgi:hypothetical protein